MESLVSTFHLDAKLLAAQVVNFAIVVGVLYWFVFKPLAKTMGERQTKIEESLRQAKAIEASLAGVQAERLTVIKAAKEEAQALVVAAGKEGQEKKEELIVQAKEEIGRLINQAKAEQAREKAETLRQLKAETAELVVAACERLLGEKIDDAADKKLLSKIIKES